MFDHCFALSLHLADLKAQLWSCAQVALDLNRNSAPGVAPLNQRIKSESPLGQPVAGQAAPAAAAAVPAAPAILPAGDAGAQPAKPPPRRAKHGRAVSFGGVSADRRHINEGAQPAAADVENGWLTRPGPESGEQLPASGQASLCRTRPSESATPRLRTSVCSCLC